MEISEVNFTEIIYQTINELFENLFSSIDNNIFSFLDDITFINTDIINNSYFEKIFGTSSSGGILLIANSLLVGLVLYYSIKLLFSNLTLSKIESPFQFVFKIVLCGTLMNFSFFLCQQIIFLNYEVCQSIRSLGENIFNKSICFSELINNLNSGISIENSSFNVFSVDGIVKGITSLGLLNLIFSYSLRYIMIKVFVLLSPFAFLCLCFSSTNWFFKSWIRCFLSLLFLQILVSLILLIIFTVNLNLNDLFSKLMYLGSIYSLIRANSYIKEFMGGVSIELNTGINNLKSIIN